MNDQEKLRVILPHWIEHNIGHGREFAKWAEIMDSAGKGDIAGLLREAESFLLEADGALKKALEKAGGGLESGGHHHGHSHDHSTG